MENDVLESWLIIQDNKCAICDGPIPAPRIYRDGTGHVVGLLCGRCSDATRLLYNDFTLTERLTAFLRRNSITPDPR